MSLGLLTALLLVGQNAKSAELPIDPNVTCTAEETETLEKNRSCVSDAVGQSILIDNEGNIIAENKVTTPMVIIRVVPFCPRGQVLTLPDLRPAEILGVMPTELLDPETANPVKDILVTVEETRTAGLLFGVDGVNSNEGLIGNLAAQQAGCYAVEEPETLDVTPAETDEAEPEVCGRSEPLPCREPEPVNAKVAELLDACRRAIADGKRDQAQLLIYLAMLHDPAGIAVNALAEKLQEMDSPGHSDEESKEQPCEDPSGSAPVDPIAAPEEILQPPLPPVDPGIVNALEKVLRESDEPTAPKLVVGMEEPAEDEPEEPVSQWRPGAPEVEAPSLLVDPEEEDASLEDPEIGEERPPADLDEMPRAQIEQVLREACEDIRRGNYVKLDKQPTTFSMPVRIGGVRCAMIADDWGHRYLIVQLTPEASGDLRLMQEVHNQRVLNWIIAHNNGGNREEGAEEPADHEDLDRLREDIEDPEAEEDAIN